MAISTIRSSLSLDEGIILAPERYHPGRQLQFNKDSASVILSDLVSFSSKSISPASVQKQQKRVVVFDTGDASEGKTTGIKEFVTEIRSNKKIIKPGDVIISRLRPYLRQVAFIDANIYEEDVDLVCSTEFYILSPKSNESIAYLVPFLLSDVVQTVLANSIEGGQHPRFNESVLMTLSVPKKLLEKRELLSKQVESAIEQFRLYEKGMKDAQREVQDSIQYSLS
ncbi:hypothetical protein [Tumebacillus flagellatus]|uniref:Type I restriction modification DNA specificity domain-containing protein n=1 Tax=Tumebacillus flagellatus TaxID=1157490 RepID=A0A074LL48_9BACL|nr:hypothetical protein [Tumebacillus flagellatus]KEO82861.1 hypothetical protein EL26_13210 [Tumebacillus flagellatus]